MIEKDVDVTAVGVDGESRALADSEALVRATRRRFTAKFAAEPWSVGRRNFASPLTRL
jgi:hypothetical protein